MFMLANTVYLLINRFAETFRISLFAIGETSLPKSFQVMVLSHTGVGIILTVIMIAFALSHLPAVWKHRHRTSVISGISMVSFGILLLVTGLFILTAAASRDNRWAWWLHVIVAFLAPTAYVIHRLISSSRPVKIKFVRFGLAAVSLSVLMIGWNVLIKIDLAGTKQASLIYDSQAPGHALDTKQTKAGFTPAAFVPPASPFFPSAATTTSGWYLPSRIITRDELHAPEVFRQEIQKNGFVVKTLVGAETCVRCHQDIVSQWAASAHRFASFNNPFYEATINDMRRNAIAPNKWIDDHVARFPELQGQIGMAKSKWCSGCHDPALMLAGKMNFAIDRVTPEAQAGLTCLACHAIDKIHNLTGNGNYNIADEEEDPYLFASAQTGTMGAFLHDAALKARPSVHKRQMLKPFFRESEFCGTCHKVSLREPVNNYRWLRGQNEYDNWHDSGIALNASRTFYLPPQKRRCQDCHMPPEPAVLGDVAAKNGMVRSHRFLAVNTALPFVRGDHETIARIERFLRDEKLSVDIFALTTESHPEAVMAIDKSNPDVIAGETITVDVVVRNKGVGHTFPGGTNDSNEGWLEFTVMDEYGKILAQSGFVESDGHLNPYAHVYKAVVLDKYGHPINKRNAQDIHVTVFANVIGPGTADVAHYEFVLPPESAGQSLTLRARLLWRKFTREYTEFAFYENREGFKKFDAVPNLPITEIATHEIKVFVNDKAAVLRKDLNGDPPISSQWMRYNDYGIASLLEGNTRQAVRAFEQVMALLPDKIDGPLNLAKTRVRDGNINKAYEYLKACEKIDPGNARAAWVWGLALQEDGQYEKAALAYQRVLEQFPEDRAAWRNLGRTYYLDRKYDSALEALERVLQIDPEDRIAHYHRMLCLRALDRNEEAELAAAEYEHYQIDESAQEITRAFRLKNPGANLMAQQIRTHKLVISSNNAAAYASKGN